MRGAAGDRSRPDVLGTRRAEDDTADPHPMAFVECRVRGFEALVESFGHDPATLARWVRRVMTALVEPVLTVEAAGAILYPGGFSAFFSAPDHTRHACTAALGMIAAANTLNETSEPRVAIGVGIATGLGILGDFGTEDRPLLAGIGYGANLAATLAKNSPLYGVGLLFAPMPGEALELPFAMLQVDTLRSSDGQPAPLYTLLPPPFTRGHPKFLALKAFHDHILDACRARDWQEAKAKIVQARGLSGANRVLYDLYLERIAYYEQHPPAEDWAGTLAEVHI